MPVIPGERKPECGFQAPQGYANLKNKTKGKTNFLLYAVELSANLLHKNFLVAWFCLENKAEKINLQADNGSGGWSCEKWMVCFVLG